MTIETQQDAEALKRIGRIVSLTLQTMLDAARPGMTTRELDQVGERLLANHGAQSAPRLAYNFPGATCVSINEQAIQLANDFKRQQVAAAAPRGPIHPLLNEPWACS